MWASTIPAPGRGPHLGGECARRRRDLSGMASARTCGGGWRADAQASLGKIIGDQALAPAIDLSAYLHEALSPEPIERLLHHQIDRISARQLPDNCVKPESRSRRKVTSALRLAASSPARPRASTRAASRAGVPVALTPFFSASNRTISTSGLVARSLRSMASLSGPSLAISCPNKSTLLVRSCCSQEICARNGRLSRAAAVTCRRKAGASSGEPEIARKSKKISVHMIS